jgi:hypothetical protein
MRKRIIPCLLMTGLGLAGQVCAQGGFVSQSTTLSYNVFDQNGKSFVNPAPEVAGSPFLTDEWQIGSVVLINNQRFDSVRIRLNLLSQEVHVLDRGNNEIALARGYIKKIRWPNGVMGGTSFQIGFPAVDAQDAGNFYGVLSAGKLWLLRSIRKVIVQHKDDMSGEVKKEYQTYEDYYVFDDKAMQRVKKDKSFLLPLLSQQKDKVDGFINDNKLKLRSIDEVKRVIDYYNSLL